MNIIFSSHFSSRFAPRKFFEYKTFWLIGKPYKNVEVLTFCLYDISFSTHMTYFLLFVRVSFGHHMRHGFCLWATELARVVRKIPHFRIGIVWGAIPMSFPVFWIRVSTFRERLQNKSELVGSEGTRQVSIKHPRCVTPSC